MERGVAYGRLDLCAREPFVSMRRALGVSSFGINLMLMAPGQRWRIHRHKHQEEVYLVLEGVLTLVVEGEERDLEQGELARVAPEVRRQLVNRGPGRLAVLALGSAGEHVGRDGEAFPSWDDHRPRPVPEVPAPEDLPAEELRRA